MRKRELRELTRIYESLQHAGTRQYQAQLRYLYDLLRRTPRFRAVLDVLIASTADFNTDDWIKTKVFDAKQTCHEWPDSEMQKLRVLLRIAELSATTDDLDPTGVGAHLTYENNLDRQAQAFTKHVVHPLLAFLETRLETESEVLHQLERMRRQVEWFEQDSLYEAFQADTSKGEALYDRRVREFLFSAGSTTRSLSRRRLPERRMSLPISTTTTRLSARSSFTTEAARAPRISDRVWVKRSGTPTTTASRRLTLLYSIYPTIGSSYRAMNRRSSSHPAFRSRV